MTEVFSAPREWTRLHPVSPLLRVWPALAGVGAVWFYTGGPAWLGGGDAFGDGDQGGGDALHVAGVFYVAAAVVAVVLTLLFSYLGWRFNTYRLGDGAVEQHKGVLFRQQRQARLDRLQAVDVVQPLVARVFGFAKIKVEVAGGQDSGIALEYLALGDAEALRNEILALAAGYKEQARERASGSDRKAALSVRDINPMSSRPVTTAVAAAEEREVLAVPVGRLLASIVLSWGSVVAALVVPVVIVLMVLSLHDANLRSGLASFFGGSIAGFVTGFAGFGAYAMARLNSGFNFRAGISADGIRLRHGLFETRRQTVPPGRVQAIHFKQSLLWRRRDWWQITINVAGYQDDQAAVSTLLPVGTKAEALTALYLAVPDLGDPDPEGTIGRALSGTRGDGGFTPSPARSMVYDPLQWRQRGVRATSTALLIRRGLLVKELFVVPHERTQSLRITQGPLQRLLRLANVQVHSTKGPVSPVAQHLDQDDALALLDAQAERARQGRARQSPEQWMAKVGVPVADSQ